MSTTPPPAPGSNHAARIVAIAAGSAVVAIGLVALLVVILTRVVDTRPSPADTANAYLQAIAAGDATAANEIFNPLDIGSEYFNTDFVDATTYMSDDALGAATERISNVEIGMITRSSGTDVGGVDFRYDLAGETRDGHLSMVWKNGEWRMITGLWQTLHVRTAWDSDDTGPGNEVLKVTIGEASSEGTFAIQEGSLILYPGVYPIEFAAEGWTPDPDFDKTPDSIALVEPNQTELVQTRYLWNADL